MTVTRLWCQVVGSAGVSPLARGVGMLCCGVERGTFCTCVNPLHR